MSARGRGHNLGHKSAMDLDRGTQSERGQIRHDPLVTTGYVMPALFHASLQGSR